MKKVTCFISTFLLIPAFSLCLTSCSSTSNEQEKENSAEEHKEVIFEDDFDTFDDSKWTKETHEPGWVNQELQAYAPSQVSVGKDGDRTVLILTAERKGDQILSGRINSQGKMNFRYGTIEASIRMPRTANGLWPAFWMMGDSEKPWPQCGEIDILEMGEKNGIANGTTETHVNTAIHYGTDMNEGHHQEYHQATMPHSLQDGQYHIYRLEWTKEKLAVSIDNTPVYTFDISPESGRNQYFNDKCYALFNLAVGGAFTGITNVNDITALPDGGKAYMYVDWVRATRQTQPKP